jgi:hypothetical protein
MTFLFERFSLIPAFSRWEKENYSQSLDAAKITAVQGFNARLCSGKSHPREAGGKTSNDASCAANRAFLPQPFEVVTSCDCRFAT